MKKNIDELLAELIHMIPELKKDEDDWREFIKKFIDARPDSQINAEFKKDLHNEILKKTTQMKTNAKTEKPNSDTIVGKLIFTFLGGGALASLVIIPTLQNPQKSNFKEETQFVSNMEMEEVASADLVNITKSTKQKAFGELKVEKNNTNAKKLAGGSAKMEAGNAEMAFDEAPAMLSSRMIMPPYGGRINYEYLYEGKELPEINETIEVYKKQKDGINLPQFQDQFQKLGINLVDLKTFKKLSLDNISFTEDSDLGYQVSVNFKDGIISIHQDYQKWQKKLCPDRPYCRQKPIKKSDIPSDKKLIEIASKFLKDHKITDHNLGTPTVKKYWEENEREGEEPTYYPDSLPVIYPFLVNGQEITTQWGEKVGIRINVNIRLKKVESVNFSSLNLESSEYESSSTEELLQLAKDGGSQGVKYNNPERIIKVKLGTPKKALTQMYLTQKDGKREEIFVPALVFPVINKDKETKQFYHQKQIIVPIAKDLFEKNISSDLPIQPFMERLEMQ